jgi:hypothetical protein
VAEIFLKRTLAGTLAPADEHAEAYIRALKVGRPVRAKVSVPRNYRHHCLIMALLTLTFRNLPEKYGELWPTFDGFRRAVAYDVGHREQTFLKDGTIIEGPGSLSYEALDETAFTQVSGAMMAWCATLLDMVEPELAAEVSRYADETYGAAA